MTYTEAAERLNDDYIESYLAQKGITRRGKKIRCLDPTHRDSTPSMGYDEKNHRAHCFGCKKNYDLLDLIGIEYGISDFKEKLRKCCDLYGMDFDRLEPDPDWKSHRQSRQQDAHSAKISGSTRTDNELPNGDGRTAGNTPQDAARPITATQQELKPTDYSGYLAECRERLNSPEALRYLESRGISYGTAAGCGLGYDPAADPANNPGGTGKSFYPKRRIIVPFHDGAYMGRVIADCDVEKGFWKINAKGSRAGLFHTDILFDPDVSVVFVTEGVFDALSAIECGAEAMALNGTGNVGKFLAWIEEKNATFPLTDKTLVLCLDSDQAGRQAEAELRQGLGRLNISYVTGNIAGNYKDPNEAHVSNKAVFAAAVQKAMRENTARPDNVAYYLENLIGTDIENFGMSVSTGFSNLDKQSGGLYPGLYILAATPSLGKTTFLEQMADNIATAGNEVLYFSLEQSRLELVSKSISRRTASRDFKTGYTSLEIRRGAKAGSAAKQLLEDVGNRLSIIEGNFNCNISYIGDYIRRYIRQTDTRPVVMIDYLQILQPTVDERHRYQGNREIVDTAVTTLKQISREMNIAIIAISSVNRSNYMTPLGFESLKESGGIEFTADCVWGLQLTCIHWDTFAEKDKKISEKRETIKTEKSKTPRDIELVCLKNRFGSPEFSCYYKYYSMYETFVVATEGTMNLKGEKAAKIV